MEKKWGAGWQFETRCVRSQEGPDRGTGAVAPPIYQTSAFAFEDVARILEYNRDPSTHYNYSRYDNPSLGDAERRLAALESAEEAVLFSSGQAATAAAALSILRAGDEILAVANLYGGTTQLLRRFLPGIGIQARFFRAGDAEALDAAFTSQTRALFVETPTNPGLEILDLSSVAAAASRHGIPLLVDNTFATPCNQNPILLGADLVIHSATKYLGGHSDLTAGVVMGRSERVHPIREVRKLTGGCADPLAAFLLVRGLKTLAVRVRAQNANAAGAAAYLASHRRVTRVHYPGLESHPGHSVARRQMRGFGGIVTFEVEGGYDAACRVLDRFRLFLRLATLGGVESNAMMPVLASHAGLSDEELALAGVTRGMIRLSLGIESREDLLEDLERALD